MLAAVMRGPDDLHATEIPTPAPGPGEVLVAVGANTLCGTDLRILRGEKTAGVEPPVVLGHEIAGHVAAVGAGVLGYALGAPVVVAPIIPCRRCWECRHDHDNLCRNPRILGYGVHGGMAEYVHLPAEGSLTITARAPARRASWRWKRPMGPAPITTTTSSGSTGHQAWPATQADSGSVSASRSEGRSS